MKAHAEVPAGHLLNTALESTEAPQARVCFLEMFSVWPASSGGSPSGQDGGVSLVEQPGSALQDLSPRRTRGSTIARTQRMDRLRPWSDLKFRDRGFQCGNAWTGLDIPPLHAPDREFVPGVLCHR